MNNRSSGGRRAGIVVDDDGLSKLPDDVLLDILERTDTMTAIRTCVLSKRMLKLATKVSRIHIDTAQIGADAMADVTERLTSARMTNPEAVPIRDLRVSFVLRHPGCVSIGRSVARAMAAGKVVGAAEFDIVTEKASGGGHDNRGKFLLGDQFSKLLGACPGAFAGLTLLSLRNMLYRDGDVPGILAACGQLESLSFHQCLGVVLRLEHAHLAELDIALSTFKRVELGCLPRLQRMRCNMARFSNTGPPCMSFGFVPQLSELSLADNWTPLVDGEPLELSQLLVNASSVSDLRLDFQGDWIWVAPERPERLAPVLDRLHVLTRDNVPHGHGISWTMFFLEAAPTLKELCIKMGHKGCHNKMDVEWKLSSISDFRHRNLAKLTIYGFEANAIFLGYIMRVREAAVHIIELSLHDMEGKRYNPNTFETSRDAVLRQRQRCLAIISPNHVWMSTYCACFVSRPSASKKLKKIVPNTP